ncbi:MAG TPA: hypothetical protein VNN73_19720 [Blastocatellia bacterium]|nr:hypothetical protein [Blastocatellia bacterium]
MFKYRSGDSIFAIGALILGYFVFSSRTQTKLSVVGKRGPNCGGKLGPAGTYLGD